jgi:hypothetical protein
MRQSLERVVQDILDFEFSINQFPEFLMSIFKYVRNGRPICLDIRWLASQLTQQSHNAQQGGCH